MIPNIPLDPPDTPNPPLPSTNDPGGARAKGYSADPDFEVPELPDPIPLSDALKGGIHVPERDPGVHPTGRSAPGSNDSNERLLGEGG